MHKNIWKFWSLFCVTGAVIFILIPQIWIAFSSLLRTSGNFTLELNNDKINIIDADLEGFRVINDKQNIDARKIQTISRQYDFNYTSIFGYFKNVPQNIFYQE